MATTSRKKSAPRKPRGSVGNPAEKEFKPIDRIHEIAAENALRKESGEDPMLPDSVDEYAPLLTLSTAKKRRPTIEIDGEVYDLRRYGEFGIGDQHQLTHDGNKFDQLWARDHLHEKEKKALKEALDRMYGMVLIAPPDVKEALDYEQRGEVCMTFTTAPLQMAARRAAKMEMEMEAQSKEAETPEPETPATS